MLPYSELILENTNNYGIVKTETVFGFGPKNREDFIKDFNTSAPLQWMMSDSMKHPLEESSRSLKNITIAKEQKPKSEHLRKMKRKSKKREGKKKCVYKVYKGNKNKRNKINRNKMQNKYMMPVIIGMIAAKSILVPVALKALAFISAKGLMMGFFSTVMASLLSLKGMFDHSHGYQNRKDDSKTQVEIIQVPNQGDDHVYYDDHYQRSDYRPNLGMIK